MKYITTHKKKEGFFIIHANRNGISYCGLVKNGIEIEYFFGLYVYEL